MSYLRLFSSHFLISAFTFGGGYVTIPMMEKYFVARNALTKEELLELATIAQSSPGAIAINLAVLVGQKIRGLKGALVSGLAATLPSLLILSLVSLAYESFQTDPLIRSILKGMEAGVAAIIVSLVIDLVLVLKQEASRKLLVLPGLAFIANGLFNVHPIWIMLITSLVLLISHYATIHKPHKGAIK